MAERKPNNESYYERDKYNLPELERKFEYLDFTVKQEKPLSIRISVLEERVANEINSLRKDLTDAKSEAKFKMAERVTYIAIIVGLLTTLITKYTG